MRWFKVCERPGLKESIMSITTEIFGELPGSEPVQRFTLSNNHGLSLQVINYGGIITGLHVPDRLGQTRDVVLGLRSLQEYLDRHPYFGAIVGRVAGRIASARFTLDGNEYLLARNDSPNHLHGGLSGFDKQLWTAESSENTAGEPCVSLTYTSPDGEEGYPGNVATTVSYTLTEQNELRIEYSAETDQPTPLSLTNHSYFNLAGEGSGSIDNHILQIYADRYVPTDQDLTLSGNIASVAGKIIDFTQPRRLDEIIGEPHHIHGDNYLLDKDDAHTIIPVATVVDPISGRVMDVSSTAASLQFYTGKFLGQEHLIGKSGTVYAAYGALCLECHGYPDGVNTPEIEDIVLRPGESYQQTTMYRFSTH
jgi:aldose 1-epimerase